MPKPRPAASATVRRFERTITRTVGYKYLLSLPRDYRAAPRRRWPLLLFLHGAGERGDDVWSVARHGPPKLVRGEGLSARERAAARILTRHFILVSPQCPKHDWWDTEALLALIDEIEASHRVDHARVGVTGRSMGGYATWSLGTAYPERFAAMAPVCGGGEFTSAYRSNIHKRDALRRLPAWAFHGAKDPAVPLAESERMIALLKHLEVAEPRFTVYPEAAHDAWTEAYGTAGLFRWFLEQSLPPPA